MIIHVNTVGIRQEIKKMQLAETHLNTFYKLVDSFLGGLSEEEAFNLQHDAKAIIMDNLRARYQFSEASDRFNLEALGIDPDKILNHHKQNVKHWRGYTFNLEEGKFAIDDKQKHLEKFNSYADTEEKKKLVSLYQQSADLFNKLAEQGVYMNVGSFHDAFPSVFKSVPPYNYLKVDSSRLAMHLNHLNGISQLRPRKESAKEVFKKLEIKPIEERYKA